MNRHRSTAATVLVLAALLAACSGTVAAETTAASAPLPPHERDDLAAIFDPLVRPLGYEVTRASLIVRATYVVDPSGDHLAIYVRPATDIDVDRFAADFAPLVAVFVPYVFERWPELQSFDICQEPYTWPTGTPPSQTILDLNRQAATSVDWGELDLTTLIGYGRTVDGIAVWARPGGVRDSATWQSATGG